MRSIGPYRILRLLGSGGMAEVHLAVAVGASGFEKHVAIKTLLPELATNPRLQRLLIREACLAADLQHRNLAQVHDLGVADGVYYVRMEYIDGGDLGALLENGPPPRELALLIAREVALALDYVHRATDGEGRPLGLVHRDVSPSNILISRQGEVKLADFGIAKATALVDETHARLRKGKLAYMSPEQVLGRPLDSTSDQYGLGVTLTELTVGRRPYPDGIPLTEIERSCELPPPDLTGVPDDIAAIIRRCLAADPAHRFAHASQLQDALIAASGPGLPSAARLASWAFAGSHER